MYIARILMKIFTSLCCFLTFVNTSKADIELAIENDSAFISITKEIVDGDSEEFSKIIKGVKGLVKSGFVLLDSPGGKVAEAISIGIELRDNGFSTVVMDQADCQSACALIWLAGNKRIATSTSRIGFHQTYTVNQSGRAIPSIQGNALVGYYLGKINVNASVVSYVTAAAPETFEWLSFSKAKELGINVIALNDAEQTTMGRNVPSKPSQNQRITTQPLAGLPTKQPDELPNYKNIHRAAKNTMNKYQKDGILGLHNSSIACWKRASELRTSKSFQYCFSLDIISAYIDSVVAGDVVAKRYLFFTSKSLIDRQTVAQSFVFDKENIPNDYVNKWGRIAIDQANKVASAK